MRTKKKEIVALEIDTPFENAPIADEYQRWVTELGPEDPYLTKDTIGLHEVLRAHFLIADHFYTKDDGLGGIGPKDPNLLHSAIYRQFVSFGGKDKWRNSYERAATLGYGIISDHPFHDANKRTGLLVLLLFLTKFKRMPTIRHKKLEELAVDIADHQLNKYPKYRKLRKNSNDPEVLYIADYLKRNSRVLDNRFKFITYEQLNCRLQALGYRLHNPRNNYIDVVRIEERRKLFGFGQREPVDATVTQIGFPGWKAQVGRSTISKIRRDANLKPKDGFDSRTFYEGLDPIPPLIAEYAGPLERLAHR